MMRRFLKITLAAAVAVSLAPLASAQTLSDTMATAYRNSGLIEQNRAVLRAADEDVAQAVAQLRPVFEYIAGVNYRTPAGQGGDNLTGNLTLSAGWLLYDWGRSALSVDIAKETVLATRAALLDVENQVLLNAVNAHMSVRRAQAFVGLRQNNVRLLTQQLRATRDRFEVGEVTRTDVSLAEARLAAARSGLAAEQGGLAQAEELYRAAVGQAPGRLAAPPAPPSIPRTEEAGKALGQSRNPIIDQVQHQVRAAELGVEAAKRATYPTVRGSGTLSVNQDGDDSLGLGVELRGPIYQGGAIASGVRQAQARRDEQRARLYSAGLTVAQEVGNAYATLAVAVASIDASDRQVRAAQLAVEGVREELQLGARTTLDVLDQEQELLDAQTNLVSAQIDRFIATYQVLDATGLLTAEYLGLGVPIYDPAAYYNAVKDAPNRLVSPEGEKLDRVLRALGRN